MVRSFYQIGWAKMLPLKDIVREKGLEIATSIAFCNKFQ
jgi:hypothetical protein